MRDAKCGRATLARRYLRWQSQLVLRFSSPYSDKRLLLEDFFALRFGRAAGGVIASMRHGDA